MINKTLFHPDFGPIRVVEKVTWSPTFYRCHLLKYDCHRSFSETTLKGLREYGIDLDWEDMRVFEFWRG